MQPHQVQQERPKQRIVQRLSAQVRARLLFNTEVAIDAINKLGFINDDLLKGLVEQRKLMEKQRSDFARNMVLLIFVMYLTSNGQNLTIPGTTIQLSGIPGLSMFLGFLVSMHLVLIAMTGISVGAYSGLIYQISMRKFGDTVVDPDIHTASLAPQWLMIKLFQSPFNPHHAVHINPRRSGRAVYWLAHNLGGLIFTSLFGLIYIYVAHFLIITLPNDVFGLATKITCLLLCAYSIFLHFASNAPFAQDVDLAVDAEPNALEAPPQISSEGQT